MECVLWDGQGKRKANSSRFTGNDGRRFFCFYGRGYGGAEWVTAETDYSRFDTESISVPDFLASG